MICNSDGGRGYSQQLFQEIGKALGIKKIEYFLDAYHVNDRIKRLFSRFSNELTEKAFEALKNGHTLLYERENLERMVVPHFWRSCIRLLGGSFKSLRNIFPGRSTLHHVLYVHCSQRTHLY